MYTMYILEIGFTKKEISFAVSIFTISSLIGQNLIGFIADRYKCSKRILVISICIGVSAAVSMALSKQILFINSMIAIWGFFLFGTVPLSDAWFIEVLKKHNRENDYGKIRGLGSIGYALSGVLIGYLLQTLGWGIYFFYIIISTCFLLLSILILTFDKKSNPIRAEADINDTIAQISIKEGLSQILAIKPLRSMILILFSYYFVVKGIYSYLGVLLSDLGGGPLSLGIAYFLEAAPEIISFFLAARLLTRFKSQGLIFISFIIQIIRLTLILIFSNTLVIMLLGMLSGLAYGMQSAAYKTYIYKLAPEKYKISCLSISESIISLSGVISAPIFGAVIIKYGAYSAIAMGLAIDIIVAIIVALNLLRNK
ncbi:MFS transporter [Ruminiclostridium herbifermentans]